MIENPTKCGVFYVCSIFMYMELEKIIRKTLRESFGVPDNLINVAKTAYVELLKQIDVNNSMDDFKSENIVVRGDFKILDYTFNKIVFRFQFENVNNFDMTNNKNFSKVAIAGLRVNHKVKITKNFTYKTKDSQNMPIEIDMIFVVTDETTVSDIKNYLINDEARTVSTFAHEIKHKLDHFKQPEETLKSNARYSAHTNKGFGGVTPINKFLFHVYFIHTTESLVMPSEVATQMIVKNISRKDFYEFLKNNETYKELKEIYNFSYENLREELKGCIPQIIEVFKRSDVKPEMYENKSDDDIVTEFLRIVYINIVNWSLGPVFERLQDSMNPLRELFKSLGKSFGQDDRDDDDEPDIEKKQKYFKSYRKEMMKYQNNIVGYFKNEEKTFKFVGEKMMKKLSKLYAMARNDQNECIVDPDLWYKYVIKEVIIKNDFNKY